MPRGYVPILLVLALAWGSSFMFIEFAIEDLTPAATMAARLMIAATVLFGILVARRGFRQAISCVRQFGRSGILLGAVTTALPFWLIAWGQTHIDSGIAAIGNAAMPIFVALLAIRFAPGERVTGMRAVGIGLGILGVGVLVGIDPQGGWWGAIGTLAVVLAAVSYAGGSLYSQRKLDDSSGLLIMTASTIWGALVILPFGILQAPSEAPGWKAIMAILVMGVVATALGLLLYIHLVENYGSSRASLVVYLLPVIALFYGAVFLDEPLRATAIVGLALILGGVALGSGLVRPLRRQEPIPAPTP
ncbi:MAG: DMT family transporter [Actinomycetota bacterium]|nr:DMT family transporter [Actinomycetota bacterium]